MGPLVDGTYGSQPPTRSTWMSEDIQLRDRAAVDQHQPLRPRSGAGRVTGWTPSGGVGGVGCRAAELLCQSRQPGPADGDCGPLLCPW